MEALSRISAPSKTAFVDFISCGVLTVSANPGMRQVSLFGVGLGQISVFGKGWGYNIKGKDYFYLTKEGAAEARARRVLTNKEYNCYPLLCKAWDALDEETQQDLLARRRSLLQRKKELSYV